MKLKRGNEKLQFVVAQILHFLHVSRNGSTVSLSKTLPDFCCGGDHPRRVLSWRETRRRRREETGEETGKRKKRRTYGEERERKEGREGKPERGGGGKGGGREEKGGFGKEEEGRKGDMSKIIKHKNEQGKKWQADVRRRERGGKGERKREMEERREGRESG